MLDLFLSHEITELSSPFIECIRTFLILFTTQRHKLAFRMFHKRITVCAGRVIGELAQVDESP